MNYIYIRQSLHILPFGYTVKVGQTKRLIERGQQYMTGELIAGKFTTIVKIISNHDLHQVEHQIMYYFKYHGLHIYYDAGTEFYHKSCINYLENALYTIPNIQFEYMSESDINRVNRDVIYTYKKSNVKKNEPVWTIEDKREGKFSFRYGQKEALESFIQILALANYCGVMIAPTGWGKSLMHLLFIGEFYRKYPNKSAIIITKNKDILIDFMNDVYSTIKYLQNQGLFPVNRQIEIVNMVTATTAITKTLQTTNNKYTLYVCNIDKIASRYTKDDKKDTNNNNPDVNPRLTNLLTDSVNLGLVIFDEIHWAGSICTTHMMEQIKKKVPYIIGSSATPLRTNVNNIDNTYKLFGQKIDKASVVPSDEDLSLEHECKIKSEDATYGLKILHTVSYLEAWDNKIILPVEHQYFHIAGMEQVTESDSANITDPGDQSVIDATGSHITMYKKVFVFKPEGYLDYLQRINTIWQQSLFKKCVFYFESRLSLMRFYEHMKSGKFSKIPICAQSRVFMSFTHSADISAGAIQCANCKYEEYLDTDFDKNPESGSTTVKMRLKKKCTSCSVGSLLAKYKLDMNRHQNGIPEFKAYNGPAMLLVVGRAIEGFDDKQLEIVANMNYVVHRNIVPTIQKIGRVQRISKCGRKQKGWYICPVPNYVETRDNIKAALLDYIKFVMDGNKYDNSGGGNGKPKSSLDSVLKHIKIDKEFKLSHKDLRAAVEKEAQERGISLKRVLLHLRNYDVHTIEDYQRLQQQEPQLGLPANPFTQYKEFCWYNTWRPGECPYYSKSECIEVLKKISISHKIKKKYKIRKEYNINKNIDNKIPPVSLTKFYTGKITEYPIY